MEGPTKEELQMHWNSNRAHFDSLAKFYYLNDRKYYDKYIAPFYKSTSGAGSPVAQRSRSLTLVISIALIFLAGGAAMLMFFLVRSPDSPVEKNSKKVETSDTVIEKNLINEDVFDSDYMKGLKYVSEKEYDKAEEYLKRVPEDDENYQSAQQVLESIKYLKKYNKK